MGNQEFSALETSYGPDTFRSRTEARWAIFFEALGIDYVYEAEGFNANGLWYLPDFWLPHLSLWVEIKPRRSPTYTEEQKIRNLVLGTKNSALLISGEPYPESYHCKHYYPVSSLDQCIYCGNLSGDQHHKYCPSCGGKYSYRDYPYGYEVIEQDHLIFECYSDGWLDLRNERTDELVRDWIVGESRPSPSWLVTAYIRARAARYKNGVFDWGDWMLRG